jgi:hypothetical protein
MDARRLKFVAALLVFVLWVASLAVLAASSARQPAPRRAAAAPIR